MYIASDTCVWQFGQTWALGVNRMHTHTTRVDLKCILYISHVQPQGFKGVSEFTAPKLYSNNFGWVSFAVGPRWSTCYVSYRDAGLKYFFVLNITIFLTSETVFSYFTDKMFSRRNFWLWLKNARYEHFGGK